MVADLNTSDPLYEDLLTHGCIVGMSSYRKQGLVVRDAMTDVDNLARVAREKYFPTKDNVQPPK